MDEPQPYRWTYDRSAWDERQEASTFSVGIYQWLPKAARGLKRSTTIRVNGYVADAAAVYAKADELCDRLNREQARLDPRPAWLQKSYAVAKPAGTVKPRASAALTAAEARAVRNRVVKPLLRSAGYEQTRASTFACRRGEIVRVMHFQTSSWGPRFTVNLGLHPTFVPAGLTAGDPRRIRWTDIQERHCTVRFVRPEKLNAWRPFGSDADVLATTFVRVAESARDALERYAALVAQWCERPTDCSTLPSQCAVTYPTILRACVDMRAGRLDAAESRLAAAIEAALEATPAWHRALLRVGDQLRAARGDAARIAELLQWLTA